MTGHFYLLGSISWDTIIFSRRLKRADLKLPAARIIGIQCSACGPRRGANKNIAKIRRGFAD